MAEKPRWTVGSNQYRKTLKPGSMPTFLKDNRLPKERRTPADGLRETKTGLLWDSGAIDWDLFVPTTPERAVARFMHQLPSHVWDAAALEGNTFTLPEVQTLLEGVTVGGRKLSEAKQVLALAESSNLMSEKVLEGTFSMDRATINEIHFQVARHEALDAGKFRDEGSTNGGGTVSLGEYGKYQATDSTDGGRLLREEFDDAIEYLTRAPNLHPVERAIAYFGIGTLHQFFFDGNKRTSRLMMNGWLMSQGFDAISIPFNRKLEFNQHLITMYTTKDAGPLMAFIVDCRLI